MNMRSADNTAMLYAKENGKVEGLEQVFAILDYLTQEEQ